MTWLHFMRKVCHIIGHSDYYIEGTSNPMRFHCNRCGSIHTWERKK